MHRNTKWFMLITIILIGLLIISTFIWDNKILVLIKDVSLAGTLSFSLIKTLNINATFNRYTTTIKEVNIYGHLNHPENDSIMELDKKTFDTVYDVYSKLSIYFSNRDMSFAIPNDLFSDLMIMLDYNVKQPDFKFSKVNSNNSLLSLIFASNEFISYLLENTYDYNNGLKVTKRKELINRGESPEVFNKFSVEEDELNHLLGNMLSEYRNLIDVFYADYTPQSNK